MAGFSARPRAAQVIAIAGVAILAVGVAALATLAIHQAKPSTPPQSPAPVPTFSLGVATATPTPTPTPIPTFERDQERFLSSASGTLWRATAGSCGGPAPLVERSNDGGDTWTDVTPLYAGISQFASLDGLAVDAVEAVAAIGAECETHAVRSFTNGRFWESFPDVLPGSRYIDLADTSLVHLSSGPVNAPCAQARGLRAQGSVTALICDGTALVWASDGWSHLPALDVAALAVVEGDVLVAHKQAGCRGLALTRFSGADGTGSSVEGCVEEVQAGDHVAVAVDHRGILVWSGGALVAVPSS